MSTRAPRAKRADLELLQERLRIAEKALRDIVREADTPIEDIRARSPYFVIGSMGGIAKGALIEIGAA